MYIYYIHIYNKLFKFRKVESPLFSFCKLNEATTIPNFWQLHTNAKYENHFRRKPSYCCFLKHTAQDSIS